MVARRADGMVGKWQLLTKLLNQLIVLHPFANCLYDAAVPTVRSQLLSDWPIVFKFGPEPLQPFALARDVAPSQPGQPKLETVDKRLTNHRDTVRHHIALVVELQTYYKHRPVTGR